MQFSSFIVALMAAPLALTAPLRVTKRDVGSATIHNNCKFDIQVNPCYNGGADAAEVIPAGKTWTQQQKNFGGSGQGVSLKVNPVDGDAQNVAQFEYTVNNDMALIFYDLSLINGSPFSEWDQLLSAGEGQPSVLCPAGQSPCQEAYFWADQIATKATGVGADLDYYVCGVPDSSN